MTNSVTILILTGPSGSGKTTLTESLAQTISQDDETNGHHVTTCILHQDDYFTQPFIPYEERTDASYEDDSGIDYQTLRDHILFQIQQLPRQEERPDTDLVILVEGHLVNAQKLRLHSIPHISDNDGNTTIDTTCIHIQSIVLKCSQQSCTQRRLDRKSNRTQKEYQALEQYMEQYVWPTYLSVGLSSIQSLEEYCKQYNTHNEMVMVPAHGGSGGEEDHETDNGMTISTRRRSVKLHLLMKVDSVQLNLQECVEVIYHAWKNLFLSQE